MTGGATRPGEPPRPSPLRPLSGAATDAVLDASSAFADWPPPARDPSRPHVALNMIISVDGRVAVGGRSGPLGTRADRELFHELRARADGVLVGAGTARVENYGPTLRNPALRARREREGRPAQPLALIATQTVVLPATLPLLADPASRVIVLTSSRSAHLRPCAARVEYLRSPSLGESLRRLRSEHAVGAIICEGGPLLNEQLFAEDLVDELFLSTSPLLVGEDAGEQTLVARAAAAPPIELTLLGLLESEGALFARYAVGR